MSGVGEKAVRRGRKTCPVWEKNLLIGVGEKIVRCGRKTCQEWEKLLVIRETTFIGMTTVFRDNS